MAQDAGTSKGAVVEKLIDKGHAVPADTKPAMYAPDVPTYDALRPKAPASRGKGEAAPRWKTGAK
jgi:hypothetical protein